MIDFVRLHSYNGFVCVLLQVPKKNVRPARHGSAIRFARLAMD
jgi:hypothetical protein